MTPPNKALSGNGGGEHTPGPWSLQVGDHTHRYVLVVDSDDRTIYYKYGSGTSREADQDEANAHLIAAAPDLLDALKIMEAEKSDYMIRNNLGDPAKEHSNKLARQAISRATGAQTL